MLSWCPVNKTEAGNSNRNRGGQDALIGKKYLKIYQQGEKPNTTLKCNIKSVWTSNLNVPLFLLHFH